MKETIVASMRQKPVAILGAGLSGRAAGDLIEAQGGTVVYFDKVAARGRDDFGRAVAGEFSMVIRSPGLGYRHPWVKAASEAGLPILGELDLAALFWEGKVYGITGTNGKTTTARLLAEVLRAEGIDSGAFGNIGEPFAAEVLRGAGRGAVAVLEISSFQAEDLKYLALDALIWTNFAEDHLDYHGGLDAYFRAKEQLVRLVHSDGPLLIGESVAAVLEARGRVFERSAEVVRADEELVPEGSPLAQSPYRENFGLVARLIRRLGMGTERMEQVALGFRLSSCRMEEVATVGGVRCINDSKATNPHAVLGAVAGIGGPVVWLGGGAGKGENKVEFMKALGPRLKLAVTFGAEGPELARILGELGTEAFFCRDLREASKLAWSRAEPGDTLLLSPGFSSFDAFQNYAERGDAFVRAVLELKAEPALS
ncbi:MAG: UDP-N-acetylmuramoyl-L-alanine--D-glutamate ligase [Puniceicoccaceae bacterium]